MPLHVMWIWKCDLCDRCQIVRLESSPYSDEMADVPKGWITDLDVPEEHREHPTSDICIACPECKLDPDWNKYDVDGD